jgi:hypothetical protein
MGRRVVEVRAGVTGQARLFRVSRRERRRNLCATCLGHRRLCGKPVCPILAKAQSAVQLEDALADPRIFGASPPAAFVGSWGYPKVLAGPLVPPVAGINSAIMDQPGLWLDRSFDEILRYRFALVRGKHTLDVHAAQDPPRILRTVQEVVMAARATDTEMTLKDRARLAVTFTARAAPTGPSGVVERVVLGENPSVPKRVDTVVADVDLPAHQGMFELFTAGIPERQITRMLAVGLLGTGKRRRLVPTEWSITAVDDILGKLLRDRVRRHPWINEYAVFGHHALGNNVQILMLPSAWMFEAFEAWLTSAQPVVERDFELTRGRNGYATELAGAYYAARLPVLEHLTRVQRQAAVLVFMEVYPEWIPLGVWRFRELCREALNRGASRHATLREACATLSRRLRLPFATWVRRSRVLPTYTSQTRITVFLTPPHRADRHAAPSTTL